MVAAETQASPPSAGVRWHHWAILIAIIAIGAGLRFHQITRVGLWPDEFWSSVHLATGRGTSLFDLPSGVLFNPPPAANFENAPAWWHIWSGLRGVIHPPVYLILLRGWIDLFGDADFSTRAFSALASLAGALVLFDIVRTMVSTNAGLIGAAIMAIAPLQINISQETRPYPLLALLGLLACHALFRIERRGASTGRLFVLGLWTAATALTHYFSFGALLAIFCYAWIRLRGNDRRKTIAALVASAIFVLLVWGPFFWGQRQQFLSSQSWLRDTIGSAAAPFVRLAAAPSALLFGRFENPINWIAPAIIAYLLPLVLLRRYPQVLLWWLWIVGIFGTLLVYDCIHHDRMLGTIRYISLASVGFYAVCAVPIPSLKSWRWLVPALMLASAAVAAAQRLQEGPPDVNGDWRGLAVALGREAGPDDPIVFYPSRLWGSPGMYYLAFEHYVRNSHRPIMYLTGPADAAAPRQVHGYPKVWLVGPTEDVSGYLPGWKPIFSQGFELSGSITEMVPKDISATVPAPSRRGIP